MERRNRERSVARIRYLLDVMEVCFREGEVELGCLLDEYECGRDED